MRAFPAHVVGLWATGNAALSLGMIAYGSSPLPVLLHLGGSVLVAVFGVAVMIAFRRQGVEPQLRVAHRSVAALALGVVALVIGVAACYGPWVLIALPYPVFTALVMLRRERLPAGADGPPRPYELPVERPPSSQEVREEALEVAHARTRRRRGEAT